MSYPSVESTRLQSICAAFYSGAMSRDEARSSVIDVIFGRLRCSRVSLWRFDGHPGDLSLLCFASKAAGAALDTTESRLRESEYREYFGALVQSGMYASVDAMTDVNLLPMRENYLLPHDVRSMLDAAFTVNGRAFGMVCCEQADRIRRWRADEVAALRAMVAKLALLMATAPDEILWGTPSLPLAPFPKGA
jgi:GAF domain-containing protein